MDRTVYKIEYDNSEILNKIKIDEYFPIENNHNEKLFISKLSLNNSKLYIETGYLKVLEIKNNKLYLELPVSHINFFNHLDDICSNLLENLLNGEIEDIDVLELETFIKTCYSDEPNINYKSIIEDNSNVLKINIFPNTVIKHLNKIVKPQNINTGDLVAVLFGLDYISLLMDNDSIVARTKVYSYFIELHKKHIWNSEKRDTIEKWEFSSKINSDDIFIKTNTTDNDNIQVNTEVNDEYKFKSNNLNKSNLESIHELDNSNLSESSKLSKSSNVHNNVQDLNKETNDLISNSSSSSSSRTEELFLHETNSINSKNSDYLSESDNIRVLSSIINRTDELNKNDIKSNIINHEINNNNNDINIDDLNDIDDDLNDNKDTKKTVRKSKNVKQTKNVKQVKETKTEPKKVKQTNKNTTVNKRAKKISVETIETPYTNVVDETEDKKKDKIEVNVEEEQKVVKKPRNTKNSKNK